jgi:hypothetical protein
MIALFLMGLLATTVILGGVPFVLYGLMLEASKERSQRPVAKVRTTRSVATEADIPPSSHPLAA